jgi:hypothetical protein
VSPLLSRCVAAAPLSGPLSQSLGDRATERQSKGTSRTNCGIAASPRATEAATVASGFRVVPASGHPAGPWRSSELARLWCVKRASSNPGHTATASLFPRVSTLEGRYCPLRVIREQPSAAKAFHFADCGQAVAHWRNCDTLLLWDQRCATPAWRRTPPVRALHVRHAPRPPQRLAWLSPGSETPSRSGA